MRRWAVAWLLGAACGLQAAAAQGLHIEADDEDVRSLLSSHLDLARALARPPAEGPLDELERQRLCAQAPQQARELMRIEGYYAPLRIELDCPTARLLVQVGTIARLRSVELLAPGVPDEQLARWREWLAETTLRPGRAFVRERWSDGKQAFLARLRAHGHPLARWGDTEARVDAATQAVDATLPLLPGPAVRIGEVRIEGLRHHDEDRVRALLGLAVDQPVSEALFIEAQQRLLRSQLFDSALVELDPESLEGERMAVRVRLRESPLQQLGLGLGWSNLSRGRLTLEHLHRRPANWPLRARTRLAWAQEAQTVEAELSTHPGAQQQRWLVAARWEREQGDEAPYSQGSLRLGQVRESPAHDRAIALEWLTSKQDRDTRSQALLLHLNPSWRRVDSVLLPTEGQSLSLQSAIGRAEARSPLTRQQGQLLRLQARWQSWWPLPKGRGLSARLEVGRVWAPAELEVPESLRFRVGGDESVRGYEHRALGPEGQGLNGREVGGRLMWSASLELQQPLPRWRGIDGLGLAAFVDAGQAAQRAADLRPAWGRGLGLRWRSPIGLLRADRAKGEKAWGGGWRLHISVGMAL